MIARVPVVAVLLLGSMAFTAGCASKKHVARETAPIINKVNELDDLTSKTTREIRDTDQRAQQGIQGVQAKASEVDQKATTAGQQAEQAQQLASKAVTGVDQLTQQVANLDNYRPVAETSVHFGFDKADLSKKAKEVLDQLASQIPNTKGYIVAVEGGTDSTGDKDYNYQLSQRRADTVIQYMAQNHNIPAHKIYLIGLGEDKPAAKNTSAQGRAENRRVDVRLMTNVVGQPAQTSAQQ
ncbi:MAG TPA: OmpA family protein [Clostridia bacterium]|nr:OmpA family protein [Clostridia bacterium]